MRQNSLPYGQQVGLGQGVMLAFQAGFVCRLDLIGHRLDRLPATVTCASSEYWRPVLPVSGTTTTRARLQLAASLLIVTAGRVLRISLLTAESNSGWQISPRFISHINGQRVTAGKRLSLALLVGCHCPVAVVWRGAQHVRPQQVLNTLAYPPLANCLVQTLLHCAQG